MTTGFAPVTGGTGIPRRSCLAACAGAAGTAIGAGTGFWAGRRRGTTAPPLFRKLTFRDGQVRSARFANDGSVVYAAKWGNNPLKLYHANVADQVAREIGVPGIGMLAAVSSTNELAVILEDGRTLAHVPLAGGAPRQVLGNAIWADWSPDGNSLAIIDRIADKFRIQYPIGNTLLETPRRLFWLKVSPSGDLVAYSGMSPTGPQLAVLDRAGKEFVLTRSGGDVGAIGGDWTPDSKELWYAVLSPREHGIIYAINVNGRKRVVTSLAGLYSLESIGRNGNALLNEWRVRNRLMGQAPGENSQRDLAWVQYISSPMVLSPDGTVCAFTRITDEGSAVSYLRRTDGSPAVRLAAGSAVSISPDKQWVQVNRHSNGWKAFLVSTGAGQERPFDIEGFEPGRVVTIGAWLRTKPMWSPDFSRVNQRGFTYGAPRSESCARSARTGRWMYCRSSWMRQEPSASREGRAANGYASPFTPVLNEPSRNYAPDSSGSGSLRVDAVSGSHSIRPTTRSYISRLGLNTGTTSVFKEVRMPDQGFFDAQDVRMTPDGRAYVYNYDINASELYLAVGLSKA